MKFFVVIGIFGILAQLSSALNLIPKDIRWTQAINEKLCEAGAHPDAIAEKFYACYDEKIVPGGNQFVKCMDSVYKVRMDTEAHLDIVCNAPGDKFPKYASCLMLHLPLHGVLPSTAIHKLNQCQGAVLGVAEPED